MGSATDIVRDAARLHAKDLYLSALLAPHDARDDLIAIAAFHGEVVRVPLTVSEPMLGEIRLQWWRDAIEAAVPVQATGNPTADAILDVSRRHRLDPSELLAPIDACDHLLAHGAFDTETEFKSFVDGTWAATFRLSTRVLNTSVSAADDAVIMAAGDTYGRTRVAIDLPHYLARGYCPLPIAEYGIADPRGTAEQEASRAVAEATHRLVLDSEAGIARVQGALPRTSQGARAALRPVALVGPYLRALQRAGRNVLRDPADIAPLERVGRLWLASWRDSL